MLNIWHVQPERQKAISWDDSISLGNIKIFWVSPFSISKSKTESSLNVSSSYEKTH